MKPDELRKVRARTAAVKSKPTAAVAASTEPTPVTLAPVKVMDETEAAKAVLALRLAGHTMKEIGTEIGASPNTVRRLLKLSEPKRKVYEDLIDGRAVPAAIDNLIEGLEAGDKDYTIKTLEGRGLLVKHSHADAVAPKSAFQFNIVVEQPGEGRADPILGSVVGVPRALEGDAS